MRQVNALEDNNKSTELGQVPKILRAVEHPTMIRISKRVSTRRAVPRGLCGADAISGIGEEPDESIMRNADSSRVPSKTKTNDGGLTLRWTSPWLPFALV